jgi:hypothetical protein
MTAMSAEHLPTKSRLLVDAEATVKSAEFVVLINKAIVSRQKTNERIRLTDVALQSQNANRSILIDKSLNSGKDIWINPIVFSEIPWRVVGSKQQSERVSIDLPGEFHRHVRIDDRSRVNGGDLRAEDVDAFEKEWSLLFEEDRKTLVRRHYQLVRLDLGEIGIKREVERDCRSKRVLAGQTELEIDGLVYKAPGIGSAGEGVKWERSFRLPVSETVKLGISSRVRSVEIPSRPVRWPAWPANCSYRDPSESTCRARYSNAWCDARNEFPTTCLYPQRNAAT